MADVSAVRIESNGFSENTANEYLSFDKFVDYTINSGTGLIENPTIAQGQDAKLYILSGKGSLKVSNLDYQNTDLVFSNTNENYQFVSDTPENFFVSTYILNTSGLIDTTLKLQIFQDGVDYQTLIFTLDADSMPEINSFYRFGQRVYFDSGYVYTFKWTLVKDAGHATNSKVICIDGFAIQCLNKGTFDYTDYSIPRPSNALTQFSFDYNNAGAGQAYTTGELVLQNDGAGAFTNTDLIPTAHVDIYDTTTDTFDFATLNIGDAVLIRLDITVTTTVANQIINSYLELGQGVAPYPIMFHSHAGFKTIDTYENLTVESRVTILNDTTRDNPAQFKFNSDDDATVLVNGYNITVLTTT